MISCRNILPFKSAAGILVLGIFALFFCPVLMLAQEPFEVKYNLRVNGDSKEGTKIVIERDGQKWKSRNGDDGKNTIALEYQHDYLITFSKTDYVTKKIFISTKVPKDKLKDGFNPYVFDVTIFKQYNDVNIVVFGQPVAKIIYKEDIDDFGFDTDYSKFISDKIDAADKDLKKHSDDEKANPQKYANQNSQSAVIPQQTQTAENTNRNSSSGDNNASEGTNRSSSSGDKNVTETTDRKAAEGGGIQKVQFDNDKRGKRNGSSETDGRNAITARAETDPRNSSTSKAVESNDPRNKNLNAKMNSENNPPAVNYGPDKRDEKEYVEGNAHVTEITITRQGKTYIYKKVVFVWGVFYKRDNKDITQAAFVQEAL